MHSYAFAVLPEIALGGLYHLAQLCKIVMIVTHQLLQQGVAIQRLFLKFSSVQSHSSEKGRCLLHLPFLCRLEFTSIYRSLLALEVQSVLLVRGVLSGDVRARWGVCQRDALQIFIESVSMSNYNYDAVAEGETLFEYLKRKKKCSLEETLSKSISGFKDRTSHTANTKARQVTFTPKKLAYRQGEVSNAGKATSRLQVTHTPEKSGIKSQSKPQRYPSFMDLISPHITPPEGAAADRKLRSSEVQNFSRKNITRAMEGLKGIINKLLEAGKTMKNKTSGIAHQLASVCSECEHPYLPQIKQNMRIIQNTLVQFDQGCVDDLLGQFHRSLADHIESLEGALKDKTNLQTKPTNARTQEIDQLRSVNGKLEREISQLNRKLEKMETERENALEASSRHREYEGQTKQKMKAKLEEEIQQLKKRLAEADTRCQQLSKKTAQLEKYIKNEAYLAEETDKKHKAKLLQINSIKEEYFFKEADALRKQFAADLSSVTQLSKIKQRELLDTIDSLNAQLKEQIFEQDCTKEAHERIFREERGARQEARVTKLKNEELLRDMQHLNRELYQHWLALKDVKTLTKRLNTYSSIQRIYDDLLFNETLFR